MIICLLVVPFKLAFAPVSIEKIGIFIYVIEADSWPQSRVAAPGISFSNPFFFSSFTTN
jgi:hypothetical protein